MVVANATSDYSHIIACNECAKSILSSIPESTIHEIIEHTDAHSDV